MAGTHQADGRPTPSVFVGASSLKSDWCVPGFRVFWVVARVCLGGSLGVLVGCLLVQVKKAYHHDILLPKNGSGHCFSVSLRHSVAHFNIQQASFL